MRFGASYIRDLTVSVIVYFEDPIKILPMLTRVESHLLSFVTSVSVAKPKFTFRGLVTPYGVWYLVQSLHWRHNEPNGVSNHQPRDWLLNCLFRCRSKKTSKLCVTGLCVENSPGTGEFSAQKASNAENVFIWWRHHDYLKYWLVVCYLSAKSIWHHWWQCVNWNVRTKFTFMKFESNGAFYSIKCNWECHLQNGGHFVRVSKQAGPFIDCQSHTLC